MSEHWPVLTVRPPWSWAIAHEAADPSDLKPVENRGWYMKYRGPMWLHAGARSRWDPAGADFPPLRTAWERHVRGIPGWPGLPCSDVELGRKTTLMPFGAVTALTEVVGCHHADRCRGSATATARGLVFCDPWAAGGQFHIELTVRLVLPEPVPCRGSLGLWRLPDDVESAVQKQLEGSNG